MGDTREWSEGADGGDPGGVDVAALVEYRSIGRARAGPCGQYLVYARETGRDDHALFVLARGLRYGPDGDQVPYACSVADDPADNEDGRIRLHDRATGRTRTLHATEDRRTMVKAWGPAAYVDLPATPRRWGRWRRCSAARCSGWRWRLPRDR